MDTPRALCIGDILDLIFREIEYDKPALAACARTCRWISPMALDYLWKELDKSTPMKKLLPNLWNEDGTYKTAVHPDEWKRFDEYAGRVEDLGVDELDTRERYLWQLYCQLCSLRPGVIPFPNLRKLRLYQDYEQADHAASLLLFPPSLRSLRVDFGFVIFNSSLRVAEGYLQAAAQQVPMLEHLSMHGDPPGTSYMCLMQYKHLHTLDLRHSLTVDAQVYRDLVSAVSCMKDLVELHLPDQGMNGINGHCIPNCRGFLSLQVLGIHASPKTITQFLHTLDTLSLRAVICKGGNIPSTSFEWRECVRKLCVHHGASLRSVHLQSHAINVWDDSGSRQRVFRDITASLLELHLLEDIMLEFLMADLPTEDLYAVAAAWPNLRRLKIISKIDYSNRASDDPSTYNCLILLAQLCPKLIHLELCFQDDKLPDIAECPLLSHGLRELKLDVPHRVKDRLIPFLDRIFPQKHLYWTR